MKKTPDHEDGTSADRRRKARTRLVDDFEAVPDLSSVPPEWRPSVEEREIDERASRCDVTVAARKFFDQAWSKKAMLLRAKRGKLPAAPRDAIPEEWAGADDRARVAYRSSSLTFVRLCSCVRALAEEGIPSDATRAESAAYAERVVYLHRLCRDADLDYRREPFRGTNRRAWVLPALRRGSPDVVRLWYGLVEWALRELDPPCTKPLAVESREALAESSRAGSPERKPLTADARRVLATLLAVPPSQGLTAKEISFQCGKAVIPEQRIRDGIRRELLRFGLANGNDGRGYYIRESARADAQRYLDGGGLNSADTVPTPG